MIPKTIFKKVTHVGIFLYVCPQRDWKDPPDVLIVIICRWWVFILCPVLSFTTFP